MKYVEKVLEELKEKNADQPEFIEAATEVLKSLEPVFEAHPEYEKMALLERITEPERQIMFRVPWVDDNGKVHVNRGFRVQFNSAIGPYKGGLRFHPSVNLGIIKFLGFEQIFKNSLTTLPIGGGKGGSDFDPQGKSDAEIMRFCQSFMTELYRHIGPDVDVPAGDIGVGGREIGYLYGQYKRITNSWNNGVLTGKGMPFGGSLIRPEATGYGAVYYANEVLEHFNDSFKGKTIVMSGYGNVAWGIAKKATEYGAQVVTISGRDGYVYDKDGVNTEEKFNFLLKIRNKNEVKLKDYADKFGAEFHPNEKPWGKVKADMAFPSATQNEINEDDAKSLVASGVKYVFEAANMPTTPEGVNYFLSQKIILGPAKACNAGGVAVSALEMSQNSMRYNWTEEEVDTKLHQIMKDIVASSVAAAKKYGLGYDLIKGGNIAGFEKVASAMIAQGLY